LVFTVGVALELLAPSIKENNGDSALNPLLVRDTLTIVVPDNTALLPTDEIIATWTGADGTPAGGSHTSVPRAVSEGLEFAIPNSVVAFNLGKQVKISYVVIIDGHPTPSRVFDLTVQAMPQSALAGPTIEQADNDGAGPELHTGNLTQASVRMGDWPLIALNQYVWLRLCGTYADGSAYTREIWSAPTAFTNPDWIADRFFTAPLPADELNALQDGSDLELVFKAALGQSTVESEAVAFPVRTYTIKAFEDVRPEITRAENSKGEEILPGATTVDTSIKLKGKGAKGQKVLIKDGNIEIGIADIDPQSGDWEFPVTGLSADTHSFTATAMYGSGEVSDPPRIVVVVAADIPAITSVKDESNWNIPENGYTVHTSIKLTGSAPAGQDVEVFLDAISKGIAEAQPDMTWTLTVSGLTLDVLHTLKAVGQYAEKPTSNRWRLTSLNGVQPHITEAHDSSGQPISNGGSTPDTRIRLTGTANTFLEVEIYDGDTATGKKPRANDKGIWTVELTELTTTKHEFKAKALYGSGTESGVWTVTAGAPVFLVEDFMSYPAKSIGEPGEFIEGTHTKITLITAILSNAGNFVYSGLIPNYPTHVIGVLVCRDMRNKLEYSLELKQGSFSSAIISGTFDLRSPSRIGLVFLRDNIVVSSIPFQEGIGNIGFEREVAPSSGQAFDAIKFVMTPMTAADNLAVLMLRTFTFKA
jgi:hypothetical protein